MSPAGDTGANRSKNDISADELLALLHKSVEKDKDKPRADDRERLSVKSVEPLRIDDSTFDAAKNELYRSEDELIYEDLDIDELLRKYAGKPSGKRSDSAVSENAPAPDDADVTKEADSSVRADAAAADKTPDVQGGYENDVRAEDSAREDFETDDGSVSDASDTSFGDQENISADARQENINADAYQENIAASVVDDAGQDDDMKVVPEAAPEKSGGRAVRSELPAVGTPETDSGETAVFDIKKVRDAVSPNDEFGKTVDEAIENAATEIFDTVRPDASAKEPSAEGGDAPKVYGEPDPDEIDQTDLNLMIAFGMNDELKEKVGEEKATELAEDMVRKHEETERFATAAERFEYTSRTQNAEILADYKKSYYGLLARIIFAVVLTGGVFLLENFGLIGLELPAFLKPGSYPVVYSMVDLQFVVLAGALVYRQLIDGVKNLFSMKPTSESMTAFVVFFSAVYTVAACLLAPRENFRLYNLPVMLAVLLALIGEFLDLKREVFSFNVVSAKRRKFVVTPVSDATDSLEREIFSDYIPADSEIIRAGRADFVDGFFARERGERVPRPMIGVLIPVVLFISAAFFILSYLREPNIYSALTNAFIAFTATMPLSTFVICSYPFYKASRDAYDTDSAIIGETSLGEYAGASVISFEDKEVFPPSGVKVTSIKVYGNNRIDEIIYNLASAFIKVGGPLADVFSQATHDIGHSENVVLESVDEDGFTVTVDEVSVSVGKASYMEKQDFDPPYDAEDKRIEASATVGILYIAYQGQLSAKVYVQYTIDNEFEKILEQLYKTGMCVGIKSFDPNIDDLLLAKKIKAMKYPVKVIRSRTVEDIPHTFERCESGIVSKRSVKELLRTVTLCEKVGNAMKAAAIVKILALLLGVVAMVFVYSFASEITVNSLYTAAYQLIWLIPVLLISHFTV